MSPTLLDSHRAGLFKPPSTPTPAAQRQGAGLFDVPELLVFTELLTTIAKMPSLKIVWLFIGLFIVNVFCAPTAPAPEIKEGSVISVKPTAFEDKRTAAGASIHPGVVAYISGGKYLIAMVSKNLPLNPPQMPFSDAKPGTTMYGNINLALSALKEVDLKDLRPWMDDARTFYESPMTPKQLTDLRAALVKNKSWKPQEGAQLEPYVRKRKHGAVDNSGNSGVVTPTGSSKHGTVSRNPGQNLEGPSSAKKQRLQTDDKSKSVVASNLHVPVPVQRMIHPLPARPKFAISAQ